MDIPFYTDIYAFPGPWRYVGNPHRPHFKRSQVIETSKETIINDAAGNLRYSILLVSAPLEDGLGFLIRVVHYYPNSTDEDNELVMTVPEDGSYTREYKKIEHAYHTCVQQYNSLVKAETKNFDDIDIYKDKIGYRETCPDCCMFCKWSRMPDAFDRLSCGHLRLECHNPSNAFTFASMVDDNYGFPNRRHYRYWRDDWQKLPWMKENPLKRQPPREDGAFGKIFPKVDPFGKCKKFERPFEDCGKIDHPIEEVSIDEPNPDMPSSEPPEVNDDNASTEAGAQ